jgi:hypothetical protein
VHPVGSYCTNANHTLQKTPSASFGTSNPRRLYRERITVHWQASALRTRCRVFSVERGGTYISHWASKPVFFTCVFFLPLLSASILLSHSSLPYIFHSQRRSWHRYTSLFSPPHRFIKPFHFILVFFFGSTLILNFLLYLHHLSVYTLYIILPLAYPSFPHHILRIFCISLYKNTWFLSCHHAAYPWMSSFFLNVFSIFSEKLCHTATLQRTVFHFPPFLRSTFLPV